ncbi:MAG: 2OG-Fe(II) oxygenase [Ferruginibacter sp.]
MADFKDQLLNVLGEIKGSGSFVSSNAESFLLPGLDILGVGEIGFPINTPQIKEMIKVAHKAPFGKGSETVIDTNVRSAWEIDAGKISFRNKDWAKFVEVIIKQIKPDLGLEGHSVTANLYKLLIYEKGDFFVAHKDSEKEKGMFGTLIIALPSKHTGGELFVRFDGQEKIIDFSGPASQYKIPFAAFYADCEHEIRPINSGHRVSLVYNLVQKKGGEKIELNPLGDYVDRLSAILKTCIKDEGHLKVVLLGHQYTPSNFTMETLKLNDRPKAAALIQAAQKAGFYFKLGLVTSYQMGELEISSKRSSRYGSRRSYDDDDYDDGDLEENGTMGEVYEEYIQIEHWMKEGAPPLRNITIEEEDLISDIKLNEDEPIEKAAEGYTGNAGMEMQYWYHYGAVFLWPKKYHYQMLMGLKPDNKLEWIDYYNENWESLGTSEIEMTKQLAESGLCVDNSRTEIDFGPLVDWLINLNDLKYLSVKGTSFLVDSFIAITVEDWVKLFENYPPGYFENTFAIVAQSGKPAIIGHILAILNKLHANKTRKYKAFISNKIELIPVYLNSLNLSAKSEEAKAKNILRNVLEIGKLKEVDSVWLKNTTNAFTRQLSRQYVNDVLMSVMLEFGEITQLSKQIIAVCKKDLGHRVDNKPQPPADWSRTVPDTSGYEKVWKTLAGFLQSPVLYVFDYQKPQAERGEMEHAIRSATIDIKMETIKKGSPHTLRLIKTQGAYERDLAKWKIDVGLLEKAEKL